MNFTEGNLYEASVNPESGYDVAMYRKRTMAVLYKHTYSPDLYIKPGKPLILMYLKHSYIMHDRMDCEVFLYKGLMYYIRDYELRELVFKPLQKQ